MSAAFFSDVWSSAKSDCSSKSTALSFPSSSAVAAAAAAAGDSAPPPSSSSERRLWRKSGMWKSCCRREFM